MTNEDDKIRIEACESGFYFTPEVVQLASLVLTQTLAEMNFNSTSVSEEELREFVEFLDNAVKMHHYDEYVENRKNDDD